MRRSSLAALLGLLLIPALLLAQAGTVMPVPKFSGFDNNGNPISGGKLCSYVAGTTTPITTYSDVALTAPNTNPVILDSAGRATVFLTPGSSYKFILLTPGSDSTCSTGSTIWTQDNVSGVPSAPGSLDVLGTAGEALTAGQAVYLSNGSGGKVAGNWYKADATNTYSSTSPVVGMVPAAISAAATGSIRIAGQVTGLGGLAAGAVQYISATPGAITSTAPTFARRLGQADSTTSLMLQVGPQDASTPSLITTTGTQTALPIPAGSGPLTIVGNNASLLTLQGIAAGQDGQTLTLVAKGAGQIDLVNQSGSASAANRLINGTTATRTIGGVTGVALLQYDAVEARWRVMSQGHDYEDGTWTPVIGGDGGTSGQTYSAQVGNYIKVGRHVTAWGRATLTAKGTITGNAMIGGLPFTAATTVAGGSMRVVYFTGMSTSLSSLGGPVGSASAFALLYGVVAAGATSTFLLTTTDISNTTDLIFQVDYLSAQ